MSTRKLSFNFLQGKDKEEMTETLNVEEDRITTVKDKISNVRRRIHREEQKFKRVKLHSTRKKKNDLNIEELKSILEVLIDSKNELQTRLNNENNKLTNL